MTSPSGTDARVATVSQAILVNHPEAKAEQSGTYAFDPDTHTRSRVASSETSVRVAQPTESLCPECGKRIRNESKTCVQCGVPTSTKNLLNAARIGRLTANGPEAQAKRATKARANALAQHSWKESDQPAWLTPELFSDKIQPL